MLPWLARASVEADWLVQQFYATNKSAYTAGETVRFSSSLLITPSDETTIDEVISVVESEMLLALDSWEQVGPPGLTVSVHRINSQRVIEVLVEWSLKHGQPGMIRLPRLRIPAREFGRISTTDPPRVLIYEHQPALHRLAPSVAKIEAIVKIRHGSGYAEVKRMGTATLVANDALLTSLHVVVDARHVEVTLPSGKRIRTKRVWALDPKSDIAVLHIDSVHVQRERMTPLPMANREFGDEPVFTLGFPGASRSLTVGVLSGPTRLGGTPIYTSSNPIRPGDSGGPLVSLDGEVLGIVSAGTVPASARDVFREEVCISTTPDTAMEMYRRAVRPRTLRKAFREDAFSSRPSVQAMRLLSTLQTGVGFQNFSRDFRQFAESSSRRPNSDVLFVRGNLYRAIGRRAQAQRSYESALELDRQHFLAAYLLASENLVSGDYDGALRRYVQTEESGGYPQLAIFGQARTLLAQRRFEEAAALYMAVLEFDSEYQPALYDLAICQLGLGQPDRANQILAALRSIGRKDGGRWAARLQTVLTNPVLQPIRLIPQKPAEIREIKPE